MRDSPGSLAAAMRRPSRLEPQAGGRIPRHWPTCGVIPTRSAQKRTDGETSGSKVTPAGLIVMRFRELCPIVRVRMRLCEVVDRAQRGTSRFQLLQPMLDDDDLRACVALPPSRYNPHASPHASRAGFPPWPLRGPLSAGRRGHGRGLPGARSAPATRRRDQGPASVVCPPTPIVCAASSRRRAPRLRSIIRTSSRSTTSASTLRRDQGRRRRTSCRNCSKARRCGKH